MSEFQEDGRFSRLKLVLGDDRLADLQASCVMVLGLGGVGSACAEALARGGVGSLILIDGDTVEISNINRQFVAYSSTIGRDKTEVMKEIIAEINPHCKVYDQKSFLLKENIQDILGAFPRPDYVIDCIDTISPKLAIAEWAVDQDLPLISSMGAANKFDPSQLQIMYIEETKNCPLSRTMRRECRQRKIYNLEVLASNELPQKVKDPKSSQKADTLGTMSYMPPIMGMMLAGKVICRLAKIDPPAKKLTIVKE